MTPPIAAERCVLRPRFVSVFVVQLRLALALCLAGTFSGIPTGVAELVELVTAPAGCAADCPEDDEGECPPGCEACVCCFTFRTAVVAAASPAIVERVVPAVVVARPESHPVGVSHRVFRPPRVSV